MQGMVRVRDVSAGTSVGKRDATRGQRLPYSAPTTAGCQPELGAAPFTYRVRLKAINAIILRLCIPASASRLLKSQYQSSAGICPFEPVLFYSYL
jgi:hypothetical protein